MDRPGENPADVGSASPATPPAIRVSASAHEVPGDAAATGSPPPSSSRALRAVAKRFVGAYYDHLNASPSRVARYYTEDSVFTVEDGSTPTPRGRTGKQSGNEPENQQRDELDELDFYDSGPESPMRRLLATAPSASGTDGIIARRQRLFKHRHARVVSTDVQTIPGGNVLAVVLGTLSRRDATASLGSSRAGSSSGRDPPRRGKEVTFMHSFVLRLRRGAPGGGEATTKSSSENLASSDSSKAAGVGWAVDAEAPPRDVDDFVIVNEVFRRVDPVDSNSPAATAATVLAAAMSPPPTPPRATTPEEGHERLAARANRGAADELAGEDELAARRAAATTPRKDFAVASPNPFVNEREDSFTGTVTGHSETSDVSEAQHGSALEMADSVRDGSEPSASARKRENAKTSRFVPSVAGASRPTSPDARAIPLPSPGLLSRPGSSEHRLRRVASRYDPNGEASDDDGPGRVSRALAFEQEKTSERPGRVDRSPRTESQTTSTSDAFAPAARGGGPPSARVTREHRERRRVYSSASSSPAMSAAAGGGSTHHSPFRDGDGAVAKDSPAAKRGLGFASERIVRTRPGFGPADVRDGWDPTLGPGSPMAGVPREAQRLVTLSERSDEGSQGAHSMSVSVSSQPSVSGRNSEDGDRETASYPRDDDRSLREFPVDELEPVNLDDVRVFRMQHPRGAFSGHSSRRSSPAATPSRRNSRSRDFSGARASEASELFSADVPTTFRADYPINRDANGNPNPYGGNGARAHDRGAYDARGYATRAYHSARASPVVSREGPRVRPAGVGGTRTRAGPGPAYGFPPRGGSRSAATSAAASPAPSRGGSRGGSRPAPFAPRAEYGYGYGGRRRFDSAPPSPSMGATRAEAFGARRASRDFVSHQYRSGYPRDFRFASRESRGGVSRDGRVSRASSYRVVGVGVHGETVVTSKPEPEDQLDVAVNYLSMLAAALHFTAAAVAFAVLVVAVAANKTSTRRLVARLDRIDGVVGEGRGALSMRPGVKAGGASHRAAGARAGDAVAREWDAAATSRGYSLPGSAARAAPPTPRAPTDA